MAVFRVTTVMTIALDGEFRVLHKNHAELNSYIKKVKVRAKILIFKLLGHLLSTLGVIKVTVVSYAESSKRLTQSNRGDRYDVR